MIPDVKIDFGLLDKDHPPASVELIPDEGSENLKKYKLSVHERPFFTARSERSVSACKLWKGSTCLLFVHLYRRVW